MYGSNATRREILGGRVKVPAAARGLETELGKYGARR
jgi:lipid-binding SYLF domain-containing protein